ncbi:MAG: glycosyltransferase family 2 protein [Candidatus Lindowbacteria bacterium]|nr:glycosyltransferase family 2 protein [Candidatus Lindowbacteria bacterium]
MSDQQPNNRPLLTVLVPAFCEGETVEELLNKVAEEPTDKEIVIVDDCSTDDTPEAIQRFIDSHPNERVTTTRHEINRGKGAAIRTGLELASGKFLIIQDADLELDPKYYQQLLPPMVDGGAEVVFGSRFKEHAPQIRRRTFLANKFLTFSANLLTAWRSPLSDVMTCYKLLSLEDWRALDLQADRFDIEPEISLKLILMGKQIYEVPIIYAPRWYASGKKIQARDFWVVLKKMIDVRFGKK